METKVAVFEFDGFRAVAQAEAGRLAFITLDGYTGPANQWSVELRLAAIGALGLLD